MRIILGLTFLFQPFLFAQELISEVAFEPESFIAETLDQALYNFYYDYTYVKNPKEISKKEKALTILQVGKHYSKFADVLTLSADSIRKKHSTLKIITKNEYNEQLSIKSQIGFQPEIWRNLKNEKITFQSRIPSDDYEFELKSPDFSWQIQSDVKEILGYKVQKATMNYSGRTWTAWFSEQIAIPLGPYTFGNLPGLILEMYDSDLNFHFLLSGMNQKSNNIYKREKNNIIKTTKTEFFKTEKSFHDRPDLFFNTSAVRGANRFPPIPYNPIELKLQ